MDATRTPNPKTKIIVAGRPGNPRAKWQRSRRGFWIARADFNGVNLSREGTDRRVVVRELKKELLRREQVQA